jgi:hypothetical protein
MAQQVAVTTHVEKSLYIYIYIAVSGGVFSTTKSEHHHRDPARLGQLIPVRLHFFMTSILVFLYCFDF